MRFVVVVAVSLVTVVGCKKWEDKMDTGREALIASATPCPAPATCTGSMTVSSKKVSTCSAPPASGKYAVGDTVVVKEVGDTPTLGRVKAIKDKGYDIEWAEGVTNERAPEKIMTQVCH